MIEVSNIFKSQLVNDSGELIAALIIMYIVMKVVFILMKKGADDRGKAEREAKAYNERKEKYFQRAHERETFRNEYNREKKEAIEFAKKCREERQQNYHKEVQKQDFFEKYNREQVQNWKKRENLKPVKI